MLFPELSFLNLESNYHCCESREKEERIKSNLWVRDWLLVLLPWSCCDYRASSIKVLQISQMCQFHNRQLSPGKWWALSRLCQPPHSDLFEMRMRGRRKGCNLFISQLLCTQHHALHVHIGYLTSLSIHTWIALMTNFSEPQQIHQKYRKSPILCVDDNEVR